MKDLGTQQFKTQYGGEELIIETGKMAMQATGAVTVRIGDTVILATACVAKEQNENIDYFPLLVEYEERLYAAGKISGSRFIKREGRPSDKAILTARLIDRPIRPLFPKDFRKDIQVVVTALSVDPDHHIDMIALIGASSALMLAGTAFEGPIGAARVGMNDKGEFIINPSSEIMAASSLDLVVTGTADRVLMLEAKGHEISEDQIFKAIEFAQNAYKPVIDLQNKLAKDIKKAEHEEKNKDVLAEVTKYLGSKLSGAVRELDQIKKREKIAEFEKSVSENFEGNYKQVDLKSAVDKLVAKEIRKAILEDGLRPDGRKLDEIRPITIETAILPRTHGSAMFTRGQTQALTTATLGSPGEEQIIETMEMEGTKRYMHHYNFPPYSTGEIKPMRSTSRREIGHGTLAEKALEVVLPDKEDFPYTIRLVSEILSSNGSSSMASTCGSTLALLDAGVPLKAMVSGIAMGLVTDDNSDKYKILTDLQGLEDFYGDMDFKVAGTEKGITAIQLDIKIKGLRMDIVKDALDRAHIDRIKVLGKMREAISEPRKELSPYAPRIEQIKINREKIAELIGPGGKNISKIIEALGGREMTSIDIEEDGTVLVSSADAELVKKGIEMIKSATHEPKIGEEITGEVVQIIADRSGQEIGAIVQLTPNLDGMVHISEISDQHIDKVSSVLNIGDTVTVKIVKIDRERNRINLSIKQASKK